MLQPVLVLIGSLLILSGSLSVLSRFTGGSVCVDDLQMTFVKCYFQTETFVFLGAFGSAGFHQLPGNK